ncbi:class I SAM-dependent methyltransferase [bacterium]|nr:class I SAM-dependent methyltransferase [bacterium]
MDAEKWDARYREREDTFGVDPNRFVVEAVEGLTPGTALDLACGEGRNSVWLAWQGWDVVGVDWSSVALERAAVRSAAAGVEVDWRRSDLLEWSPGTEQFDLVMVVYLQIPRDERHLVWERAAGAVAPGGRLMVIGHDSRNLTEGVCGPQSPDVLYGPAEIAGVVAPFLDVIETSTVLRPVDVDGAEHHAIDNRVVAVRDAS